MNELLNKIETALDEKLAEDLRVIDFDGASAFSDYFVIASARNEAHASSLIDEVESLAFKEGYDVLFTDKAKGSQWFLIDVEGIVVHVFWGGSREYYGLEELWKDLLMPVK